MPSEAYAGTDGEVHSGTFDVQVTEWSLDYEIKELDTSTTADAGWESAIGGLKKISGTFKFNYRAAPNNPTGSASGLGVGSKPTLTLWVNKAVIASENFTGTALITKMSVGTPVEGVSQVTCSFRNSGAWTVPS